MSSLGANLLRQELSWIIPGIAIVGISSLLAVYLALEGTRIGLFFAVPVYTMFGTVSFVVLFKLLRLFVACEKHPARALLEWVRRPQSAFFLVGLALTSANYSAYMILKPALNHHVPFWADPLLADIDRALFLGVDPWTLLRPLDTPIFQALYHPTWAAAGMVVTAMLFGASPSRERTALILTSLTMWAVLAPLLYCLMPAGGPILYQMLGYGDRFAGVGVNSNMVEVAQFLHQMYVEERALVGLGIAAMPSMHIASVTLICLVVRHLNPRWFPATVAYAILILLLSVSLGWHYAVDGIVGAGAVLGLYAATRIRFRTPAPNTSSIQPVR